MGRVPTLMDARAAGLTLRDRLDASGPVTVADAAAQSGLALRDAERGLSWLSKEYRGQLRVTSDGDLVHVFPTRFTKPWETRDAFDRAMSRAGRALAGAARFVVRAWVAVVLVSYALVFLAMILGLAFAGRSSNDSRRDEGLPGGVIAYSLLRVVGDALFWTFHPWSPFAVGYYGYGDPWNAAPRRRRTRDEPKVPLYERVNRFFFGPPEPARDPLESERLLVAAIRAGKGRIGLADVMRVTGLPRDKADPMMAKLMLDYDGDVGVSHEGGIFYRFAALRRTAGDVIEPPAPAPAWTRTTRELPALTGNGPGANLAIAALNGFNLLAAAWATANGMTIERLAHSFDRAAYPIVDTGVPIVLGVVPLVFSVLLFALPLARAVARPLRKRKLLREQGRLAVLREVVERVRAKQPVTDAGAADAWRRATGSAPDPKALDRDLVALGGDVDIEPSGATKWRFADLETEAAAVEAEREAAAEEEARLGDVVFSTDDSRN